MRTPFLLFLSVLLWLAPSAPAFVILGSGTGALLGGDLTDPENDGSDASGTGFNWTAIESSSENYWNAEGAYNIFDNKVGAGDDKWCCEGAPQWIAVKFDKPYVLTHFTLASGNDAAPRDPTRWALEGSNDGATWTPIYEWDAGVPIFGQRLEVIRFDGAGVDFPSPPPYLWFRYHALTTDDALHQINELELFGVPTVVIRDFQADPLLTTPGEPVTLTWEVDPGTTSVSISGVGDVTAQTINHTGSLTISPGPAVTTAYTMTAVHPDTTAVKSLTVSVTTQPIIRTFAAEPPIIGPGESATLQWQVLNATSLTLDGQDATGITSRTVSPAANTVYTLAATGPGGTVSRQTLVRVVVPGVPEITEFMADNDGAVLVDEDGDASDWIELFNPGGTPIDLTGWFLTDDHGNLSRWAFPAVTLAPDSRLVVFASGKNRTVPGSPLHTSFSLSASGEYLALVKPDGVTVASEFGSAAAPYPAQEPGVSFGLASGATQPVYFATATPGAANADGFFGFVSDTRFSVKRGFYTTPQTVEITTATPGAQIRYTTDGTTPSATVGTLYTGPVTLSRTTPLRAIAYKDGCRSTNVDTHTYLFVDDVITQSAATTQSTWGLPSAWGSQAPDYGMDSRVTTLHSATIREDLQKVPTLSVVTDAGALFGANGIYANPNSSGTAWERGISLEMIDPTAPDAPGFQLDCGLRIQGGAFRGFNLTPKKSFRVLFKDVYGPTKLRFPLFGPEAAREFDTLILRMESNDGYQWDNRTDVQYARDEFGRRSALALGIPTGRGRFLHLYINGVYWGIYNVVERPDSSFGEQYFGAKKDEWDGINFGTPTNEGSTTPWNTMVSLVSAISSAPTEEARTAALMKAEGRNPDGSRNPAWADFLNVENYIDYLLVNWYTGNNDWPHRNYYTGRERDVLDPAPLTGSRTSTGMHFFMWDVETSMGLNSSTDKTGDTSGVAVPYGHLRNSREFRVRFGDRAHRALFHGGALTPEPCMQRYAEITKDHASILIPELARWGDQHGTLRTITQWQTEYNDVRNNWLAVRTPGFVSVLRGAGLYPQTDAPVFSQHGGSLAVGQAVTMAANADTIYYTLDGRDPRLPGGLPDPAALVASFGNGGPVPVTYLNTGSVWKYLADGSDQGTAWRQAGFDDGAWPSGPSSLGYGSEGEGAGTTVPFGGDPLNRYVTTWFRTAVTIPDPASFTNFLLRLKYDDAAAVYLNGVEIIRTANLPANAGYQTFATVNVTDEAGWKDYTLPVSAFVSGVNVLAVEIHQGSAGSSDIRMDMFLRGEVTAGGSNVSDPLFLTQPGLLRARAWTSATGEWSALNEAYFTIDTLPADASNLVISEVSYRPLEPVDPAETAVSTDRDDYEFVELYNIAAKTLDLSGVRFLAGISFAFPDHTLLPAGGRLVLVKNAAAFRQRYGTGVAIAGEYSGNLSNDGEALLLTSTGAGTIRDFIYDDQAPWPTAADGDGYTLVLTDPETNPDHAPGENWQASRGLHGSPGGVESDGYAAWKTQNGLTDDGDADGDGSPALVEFAQGTDPREAASVRVPLPRFAGGVPGLDLTLSAAARDWVQTEVEWSADLAGWALAVPEPASDPDGSGLVTVRWHTDAPAGGRLYFRVRFSSR